MLRKQNSIPWNTGLWLIVYGYQSRGSIVVCGPCRNFTTILNKHYGNCFQFNVATTRQAGPLKAKDAGQKHGRTGRPWGISGRMEKVPQQGPLPLTRHPLPPPPKHPPPPPPHPPPPPPIPPNDQFRRNDDNKTTQYYNEWAQP